MHLNNLAPNPGATKTSERVGRGMGSKGKTCGRGHKGQKSRSGGYHKVGFEGGQNPLMRRLPKFGFNSYKATVTAELRLDALNNFPGDEITVKSLMQANFISHDVKYVKIINSGKLVKAVFLKGIKATRAAKQIIEELGGKVEN